MPSLKKNMLFGGNLPENTRPAGRRDRGIQPLVLSLACLVVITCSADLASGQLFGNRSIRRTLTRQESSTVGQITGNERYIRGQRQDAFVGTDQDDLQGFVGMEQARTSGTIASPTGGLEEYVDRTRQINRPIPALQPGDFYPARLVLPADLMQTIARPQVSAQLNSALTEELNRKINDSISVSVAGRSATLRGEVASAREKSLAELLVRFEPGIDDIANEIVVVER